MRFPSFAFAAIAGLWQQPLSPGEETITSTRHIHVTRTVTNSASTVYAVRMETLTVYMDYLPATLKTKSVPWQALPTTHLELRSEGEATSTMHIKVTQTIAQVQSTVFASKVGTSVSTITNIPQSLIEEAAEDAAELSSSQLAAAISSARSNALAHSSVAVLANNAALPSPTEPVPAQLANSSSASSSIQPAITSPSKSSATMLPIGLELRSNGATTTNGQQQETGVEAPDTVVAVIFGSSTSIMTSVPSTLLAAIASSQVSGKPSSTAAGQTTSSESPTQDAQTSESPEAVVTNAAQVKSTQTSLLPPSDDGLAATSSAISYSSTSSSKSSSSEVIFSSSLASSTTNKIYTIPVSLTSTNSPSSSSSSTVPSGTITTASSPSLTVYGSQSSASSASAADIAADNAAGASGDDSGSFKLSKAGFAAIISVVSIGVGLGLLFLILFVIAKRRQWKVRQSLARVSRRFTSRFSSHPNKPALHSEKPTLPVIEPRHPLGPRPAPSRRNQGFANLDAALQTNYRGVESVSTNATRNPEVWRKARAEERLQQQSQGQGQRKKPELRVDTGVAARMEEGRGGAGGQKKSRGDWRDLFRAL